MHKEKPNRNQPEDFKNSLIPIHWLHAQAYCEYQIYLEKVLGIEAEPTVEMVKGMEKHASLDEEHEQRAELELSVNEALVKAPAEGTILVSRDIYVEGRSLYGRIDEVVFEPSRIVVIDDKPSAFPYFTNKLQVWGYCQAFNEMYEPSVPLFGALRQEDTKDIIWLEQFSEEHTSEVADATTRIVAILSGQGKPQPTGNARKCQSCRLREYCPACSTMT